MVDNVVTDPGAAGAEFVTREISHSGDTVHLSGVFVMGIAGTEGSYTAVAINGDATNGLEVDVTRVTGTVTVDNGGTFAVQSTLQANSGVDIGDVDVTSVIPGVGATNLGKAEDAVHSSGDTGVMGLAVRNDALAALAGSDGDYAPYQVNADGSLYVHSSNSISTNNSRTATLLADAVYTATADDVSQFSVVTVTLDSSHDSATDGMVFQFSTDNSNWDDTGYTFTYTAADGARRFQLPVTAQFFRIVYTNGSTGQTHFRVQTIFHDNTTLTTIHRLVDDMDPDRSAEVVKSVLFAQKAGTGDFTPIASTTDGNLKTSVQEISDGLDIGAGNAGTETQRVSISTDDVNLASINTDAGTIAGAVSGTEMQVDVVAALPTGTNSIGQVEAVGDVAHDAAAAGNPVLIGARATADVEALTEVAEADASYVATDLQGVAITREAVAAQEIVTYSVSNTAGTEIAVTGLDAGGAGIHNYVTSILVHNSSASTNGFIQLLDGSAGTVLATIPNPAGGGTAMSFPVPLKQTTANTALFWDGSAAITTVYVTIIGYQGQG